MALLIPASFLMGCVLTASCLGAPAWHRLADLPEGQAFPSQTPQQLDERMVLLAGRNYRVNALLVHDLARGTWTSQPTALLTSRHHYATAALGGRLYVAGGCMGENDAVTHRRTNAVESYDLETKAWTPLAPMPAARQAFQLVPFRGKLYAIGGVDQEEVPITSIEVYDPGTDSWRQQPAPWARPLAWCQAVAHGDHIIIHGRSNKDVLFVRYDPIRNTFSELPSGPSAAMRNFGLARVGDTLLFVGGGTKEPEARVLRFNLNTQTWADDTPLPSARAHAGVTAIGSRVFCIGGAGPTWDWAHPNATVFVADFGAPNSGHDAAVSPPASGHGARAVPTRFAEGVITTDRPEWGMTFSPDAAELCFLRPPETLVLSRQVAGRWQPPEPLPFSGLSRDEWPFLSPDGRQLLFCSMRPAARTEKGDWDIWVVDRVAQGWGEPRRLPLPVNTSANEASPSITLDGTLYFARAGDIYRTRMEAGAYTEPEKLPSPINTAQSEQDPRISADGRMLIFCRAPSAKERVPGMKPKPDAYLSQVRGGAWSEPLRLALTDVWRPCFSPDGRLLLFSSGGDIYEVDLPMLVAASRGP